MMRLRHIFSFIFDSCNVPSAFVFLIITSPTTDALGQAWIGRNCDINVFCVIDFVEWSLCMGNAVGQKSDAINVIFFVVFLSTMISIKA